MTQLLTLQQVAEILNLKYDTVNRQWPTWIKWGVRPIRINGNPNSPPRFRRTEIEAMVEQWEVVQA